MKLQQTPSPQFSDPSKTEFRYPCRPRRRTPTGLCAAASLASGSTQAAVSGPLACQDRPVPRPMGSLRGEEGACAATCVRSAKCPLRCCLATAQRPLLVMFAPVPRSAERGCREGAALRTSWPPHSPQTAQNTDQHSAREARISAAPTQTGRGRNRNALTSPIPLQIQRQGEGGSAVCLRCQGHWPWRPGGGCVCCLCAQPAGLHNTRPLLGARRMHADNRTQRRSRPMSIAPALDY